MLTSERPGSVKSSRLPPRILACCGKAAILKGIGVPPASVSLKFATAEENKMTIGMFTRLAATVATAAAVSVLAPAQAQSPADFYKGRNVELYIGYSVGGGYDLYARVLARHIGRHIPGNPTIVVKNMEGAGSLRLANWLYRVAPKDGSVFAIIGRGTGGKSYTRCQILDPVNPLTTLTPSFLAALAVFFISSAARWLTPSGLPSRQTYSGRIALCRASIVSRTACPTR